DDVEHAARSAAAERAAPVGRFAVDLVDDAAHLDLVGGEHVGPGRCVHGPAAGDGLAALGAVLALAARGDGAAVDVEPGGLARFGVAAPVGAGFGRPEARDGLAQPSWSLSANGTPAPSSVARYRSPVRGSHVVPGMSVRQPSIRVVPSVHSPGAAEPR